MCTLIFNTIQSQFLCKHILDFSLLSFHFSPFVCFIPLILRLLRRGMSSNSVLCFCLLLKLLLKYVFYYNVSILFVRQLVWLRTFSKNSSRNNAKNVNMMIRNITSPSALSPLSLVSGARDIRIPKNFSLVTHKEEYHKATQQK